jgi:hypothetical protein
MNAPRQQHDLEGVLQHDTKCTNGQNCSDQGAHVYLKSGGKFQPLSATRWLGSDTRRRDMRISRFRPEL